MQMSDRLVCTRDRRTARASRWRFARAALGVTLVIQTIALAGQPAAPALADPAPAPADSTPAGPPQLVPLPVSTATLPGETFVVEADTRIAVAPGSADAVGVAADLAAIMRPSTGYPLPISVATPRPGDIALHLTDAGVLGDEGYRLDVSNAGVRLEAARPAGLFYGVQTLRQLLPALDREPDRTARTLDRVRRTPRIGGPAPIPLPTG